MLTTRADVERVGKQGVQVVEHPLGPQCRMLDRYWLIADPDDHGFTPHAMKDGYWESWITAWLARELTPNHAFVDVGANMGYYALMAASLGCPTVAFEPQHRLASRLVESVDVSGYAHLVSVFNAAVGNERGRMTLKVPRHHGMNASITHWNYSPSGEYTDFEVEVLALDPLVAWQSARPMVIKIDVEGAEPLVWAGMQRLLHRNALTTVLLEFRWDRYHDPQAFANQLFSEAQLGYVDYHSQEVPVDDPTHLASRPHEDWMLVIRRP